MRSLHSYLGNRFQYLKDSRLYCAYHDLWVMNLSSQPKELATSRLSRQMRKKIRSEETDNIICGFPMSDLWTPWWTFLGIIWNVMKPRTKMNVTMGKIRCGYRRTEHRFWAGLLCSLQMTTSKNDDALGHMLPLPGIPQQASIKTRWVRYIAVHYWLHSSFRGGRLELFQVGCECYGEVVVQIRTGNGTVRLIANTK